MDEDEKKKNVSFTVGMLFHPQWTRYREKRTTALSSVKCASIVRGSFDENFNQRRAFSYATVWTGGCVRREQPKKLLAQFIHVTQRAAKYADNMLAPPAAVGALVRSHHTAQQCHGSHNGFVPEIITVYWGTQWWRGGRMKNFSLTLFRGHSFNGPAFLPMTFMHFAAAISLLSANQLLSMRLCVARW